MNDQGPSSSPSRETGPTTTSSPTPIHPPAYRARVRRLYPDAISTEPRKRKSCQPVEVSFKRLHRSLSYVAARISTYQSTPLIRGSSDLSAPGTSSSYHNNNVSISVDPVASYSTPSEASLVCDHLIPCSTPHTSQFSTASGISESEFAPTLSSSPPSSLIDRSPPAQPLRDDCLPGINEPLHADIERPDLATELRSEYSVRRERPRYVFEAFPEVMAPTDRPPLQPNKSHSRPSVHQQFKNIADSGNGRRPDKENRGSRERVRKRQDVDDFKIQPKGRFTKVAQRRNILKSKRNVSNEPPVRHAAVGLDSGPSRLTFDATSHGGVRQPSITDDASGRPVSENESSCRTQIRISARTPSRTNDATRRIANPLAETDSQDIPDDADIDTSAWLSAPIRPPINMNYLKSVELELHFKCAQTRHDLITSSLAAMTESSDVGSIELATLGLTTEVVGWAQSERHVNEGRQLFSYFNRQMDYYLISLEVEMRTGCRCAHFFNIPGQGPVLQADGFGPTARTSKICVCSGWMKGYARDKWLATTAASRWPSRILAMLKGRPSIQGSR